MSRLPEDRCERIFAGETPLAVWVDYRGMDISQLRTASKISRLERLLAGKGKRMSEAEERAPARVLEVPRVQLRPMNFAGCSRLDVDRDPPLGLPGRVAVAHGLRLGEGRAAPIGDGLRLD